MVRSLMVPPASPGEFRLMMTVREYTMVGFPRLRTLYRLARRCIRDGIAGSFVECGTCNGGSGAILAHVAAKDHRPVWLFDSFEGLPDPVSLDGESAAGWKGRCLGQEDLVREILGKVGADMPNVHIVKGWFENTLGPSATGSIAVLHLDGDWYESTRQILDALYDRIVPEGFLVVDDYGHWPGCRRAVDDFFAGRQEQPRIIRSDYTGVWFRKPPSTRAA